MTNQLYILRLVGFQIGPDHTALSTFFINPQKLVSLSARRVEMSPNEFSTVPTALTSSKDLSFGVALVDGISDQYGIPRLRSLSLLPVGNFASTYTAEALVDLLEGRWRISVAPEASDSTETANSWLLSVIFDKEIDDEHLDRLRVEGLQVRLWGEPTQ
ncbi:hypothetical protein PM082_014586 [Marasmius tenuissimus]|nr:hypothetical protein PM082_014586 [Marasmius tenuissimus]